MSTHGVKRERVMTRKHGLMARKLPDVVMWFILVVYAKDPNYSEYKSNYCRTVRC